MENEIKKRGRRSGSTSGVSKARVALAIDIEIVEWLDSLTTNRSQLVNRLLHAAKDIRQAE